MATETGEGTTDADEWGDGEPEDEASDEWSDDEAEEESGYSQYARSAIVTTGSTLSGMLVGIGSALYLDDPQSNQALLLVGAAVVLQFPIYRLLGLDVGDFSTKGKIYIGFMTFVLWFLTYGLILTTGAVEAL